MSRRFELLVLATFALIGLSQVGLLVLGVEPVNNENRTLAEAPDLDAGRLLDETMYAQLGDFLVDRTPARSWAAGVDGAIDYDLLGDSPSPEIVVGDDGWLFLVLALSTPCYGAAEVELVASDVEYTAALLAMTGRDFSFLVAPTKPGIYPAQLGRHESRADCLLANRAAFAALRAEGRLPMWVDPAEELIAGKGDLVYFPQDSHWNQLGAMRATEVLVESMDPGAWRGVAEERAAPYQHEGDLTRFLGSVSSATTDDWTLVPTIGAVYGPENEDLGGETAIRRYVATAPLTGREQTLFVHDSFGWASQEFLVPFAARTVTSRNLRVDDAALTPILLESDTVVVEFADRALLPRTRGEGLSTWFAGALASELPSTSLGVADGDDGLRITVPAQDALARYLIVVSSAAEPATIEVGALEAAGTRQLSSERPVAAWRLDRADEFELVLDGVPAGAELRLVAITADDLVR